MSTAFDGACREVARLEGAMSALDARDRAHLDSQYEVIVRELPGLIIRATGVQRADAEELAQDALVRFVTAARAGKIRVEASPAGYLLVTANRIFKDRLRERIRHEYTDLALLPATESESEDAVTRLLDVLDSSSDVLAAVAAARAARDLPVLSTIAAWLEMAHQAGASPGSREVGEELGVSHTTINTRLRKFGEYLHDVRGR